MLTRIELGAHGSWECGVYLYLSKPSERGGGGIARVGQTLERWTSILMVSPSLSFFGLSSDLEPCLCVLGVLLP